MNEQPIFFSYWQEGWRTAAPHTQRRRRIALIIYLVLTLLGSFLAATQITALTQLDGLGRLLGAIFMGPMGIVWTLLETTGVIVENVRDPGLGWLILAVVHAGPVALFIFLGLQPVPQQQLQERARQQHRQQQGQLNEAEAAAKLSLKTGVPLVQVRDKADKQVKVGVDFATGQGHILVTAPTGAGKGLHLTDVLTHWPGAAVIIDPKSEQFQRTAGYRERHVGPVYHLPGHQVHLAHYYNFCDPDDIQELHDQIMRPGEDLQRIFADKSLSLFQAVGHFARARRLNPLRVLLDAAEDELTQVLAGLDSEPAARPYVRQFTNGQPPAQIATLDRFLGSVYGTFTTRLFGYQKHIDTICPHTPRNTLPREWVQQKSTLYITYNLTELEGVGGVVAAILAGLMRNHMAEGQNLPLLVAIDEMGAVRLRHLDTYLATVRGYGITMLLYAQSMSQLTGLYGRGEAAAILSNCAHQLWYPANDYQTAQYVSDLYGTTLKPNRSFSTTKRQERQEGGNLVTISQPSVSESLIESPTYSPTEVMGLPKGQVIVLTEQEQQYRFIGQRLDSREFFKQLPRPPQPPSLPRALRHYTPWLAQPEQLVTQPSETVPKDSLSATTSSSHAAPTTSTPPADTTNSPATDETAVGDTSDIVPKADIPPTKPAKKGQDDEFI